jgi:hypothetical protein
VEEIRNGYKILIRKFEMGPDFIWEHNFKMGVIIVGCEGVDWIHLAQNRS